MSISKRDFTIIVAINERFIKEIIDFLREEGYNIREEILESGDIFIALPPSDKNAEERIAAVIEIKSIPDLKGCLKGEHKHIRGQINSMHRSEYPVYFKKVLVIGDIVLLDETEAKSLISLSLGSELEHPQKVTWSNIRYKDELPHFIDKMVELILLYEETPRKLPTLEKLNISLKRMHPDKPSDFVQLQMMEVRGVGETKAELIAANFNSLDHIIEVAKEEGELFLTKKLGRPYLGDTLSRKVYASFGLELQPAKEKQARRKKQKAEDWDVGFEDPTDSSAFLLPPPKKDKKNKTPEQATLGNARRSRSPTPELPPFEGYYINEDGVPVALEEEGEQQVREDDEEEIVMIAPRKKSKKQKIVD